MSSANKPSIHDHKKSKKFSTDKPEVKKLTTDQISVLKDHEARLEKERKDRLAEKHAEAAKNVSKLALRPDEKVSHEKKQKHLNQQAKKKAPRKLESDFKIDMELDDMLAQLEQDDDFQTLTDNEKMAWLESLFFLDTGPSQPRKSLNKVKTNAKSPDQNLKINRPAPEPEPMPKPSQIPKMSQQPEPTPGVNVNLVSLAQSYFNTDTKSSKKPKQCKQKSGPTPYKKPNQQIQIPPPVVSKVSPTPPSPIPERVFFEPSSKKSELVKEESPDFEPPAPPPRSDKTKTAMMRLMTNATNILKK